MTQVTEGENSLRVARETGCSPQVEFCKAAAHREHTHPCLTLSHASTGDDPPTFFMRKEVYSLCVLGFFLVYFAMLCSFTIPSPAPVQVSLP